MNTNHLTDEALQAFLLKEIQDTTIAEHISICSICRKKLKNYAYLLNGIQKVKPEAFSFDVPALVMEKIYAIERRKKKNASIILYVGLLLVSLVVLFLLYPYLKTIFMAFRSFSLIENTCMLVSVLGALAFLLNDLFRQYKEKIKLLSL
jgi:predicted anti-sigma-YlaC factor YlaD